MKNRLKYGLALNLIYLLSCFLPSIALAQPPTLEADSINLSISQHTTLDNACTAEDWATCTALARELLFENPENANLWEQLGLALANTEAWAEAEESFQKMLTLKPNDPRALKLLAITQSKLSRPTATETLKKAVASNPNDDFLVFTLGKLYEEKNRFEEAAKAYESAFELKKSSLEYVTAASKIYFERGEHEKATALTKKALDHNVGNSILTNNYVVGLYRSGKYTDVIETIERLSPNEVDDILLAYQARAFIAIHRYAEAEALMRKSIDQAPSSMKDLQRLELARAIWANACTTETHKTCASTTEDHCCQREREAHQSLKDITFKPILDKDEYKITMGLSSALNNELEIAEAILRSASHGQLASTNANALAALAITLYLYGDTKDRAASIRIYREAIDASPDFAALDKLQQQRHWPARAVDILKNIQKEMNDKEKAKTTSCACQSTLTKPNTPQAMTALLLALLALLGLALRRRTA